MNFYNFIYSLVQLILDYATMTRFLYQTNRIMRINKIQKKCCNLVLFRWGTHLNIQSLTDRRRDSIISFIYKLING